MSFCGVHRLSGTLELSLRMDRFFKLTGTLEQPLFVRNFNEIMYGGVFLIINDSTYKWYSHR